MGCFRPYYKDPEMRWCPNTSFKKTTYTHSILFGRKGHPGDNVWLTDGDNMSYALNWYVNRKAGIRPDSYYWKTTAVKNAHNIPVFLDCWYWEILPQHTDEPQPDPLGPEDGPSYGTDTMRFCNIPRHDDHINLVFMDWSVRGVGLKGLWKLKWHREFDLYFTSPAWPNWMRKFKDYDIITGKGKGKGK